MSVHESLTGCGCGCGDAPGRVSGINFSQHSGSCGTVQVAQVDDGDGGGLRFSPEFVFLLSVALLVLVLLTQ